MRDTHRNSCSGPAGLRPVPRLPHCCWRWPAASAAAPAAEPPVAPSRCQAGSGPTVAFESIDGPPPQVFDRMVGVLDSESKLRSLSIVSREGSASYRVRSYLAAQVSHGRTTIAWVWDVYDRDQQRALRLSGEEPAGKAGRDPWAAADDLVLRRIAQAGLSGLSGMINGTRRPDRRSRASPRRASAALRWRARTAQASAPSVPSARHARRRQRARLQRPLTHKFPRRIADFAQENRLDGLPAAPRP